MRQLENGRYLIGKGATTAEPIHEGVLIKEFENEIFLTKDEWLDIVALWQKEFEQ